MSDTELTFTGERLHADDQLFGVDLLRHRAAYREAIRIARAIAARDILEMGSGTGYGTEELASALASGEDRGHAVEPTSSALGEPHAIGVARGLRDVGGVGAVSGVSGAGGAEGEGFVGVVAVDRVAPLQPEARRAAKYLRADLDAMPLRAETFDLVVSFQVIEHLRDPTPYLCALARHLRTNGVALVSTPNRANSDGENPFHVHEYAVDELRALLESRFDSVEMFGVSAHGEALRFHQERLRRIRRIVRFDPLGLRKRIPRGLVEWLFARLARVVRRGIAAGPGMPEARLEDFPIEPAHPDSLDLFAVCRGPRR